MGKQRSGKREKIQNGKEVYDKDSRNNTIKRV